MHSRSGTRERCINTTNEKGPKMSETPSSSEPPNREQLKAAFKAFKKRHKHTQLGEDSKLSRSPTTAGRRSDVVAIQPPSQFDQSVWEELVKQGKLKKASHGMYELAEDS